MGRRKRRLGLPDEDIMAHCVNCGALLDMETGTLATPDWYKETRFVHYCRECQKAQFEDYTDLVSVDMAFYLCCAAYNLPFVPEAVPSRRNVDGETWGMYLENLKMLDQDVTDNGEPAAFSDGMTDLAAIFDGKIPSSPVFAGGLTSGGVAEKLEGTRAQRKNWGLSYTTAEYKELDRLYGIQSKSYRDSGIDDELEYNLREISKLQLLYSQQLAKGEIKLSKTTYDVISKMRADNLMRKRDEAPAAAKQIDTLMACLERKGMARDGKLLPYSELLSMLQRDHPHYPMGHDMLDQIIGCMWNAMRINEGAGEAAELPQALQIDPMFDELDEGRAEQERRVMQEMGLAPVRRERGTENGGG